MKERLALVLLGGWLAGTVIFAWMAAANFRTVDRLLRSPERDFAKILEPISQRERRSALRHLVSELNRYYFRSWNFAQLALGALVLALILGPDRRGVILLAAIMLTLALASALFIVPTIIKLGRSLDFAQRIGQPPELRRFWIYHSLYVGLDLLKLALGFTLAALLVRGR